VALMEIYTPLSVPGASGAISGIGVPGGIFGGYLVHAVGGAAVVKFYDNASAASGTLLGAADLAASGVGSWAYVQLTPPVRITAGVYFEIVSGAVEGSILIA
jgi:hypothetical protein